MTDNLLDTYMQYVEETESPRQFHKWVCISMVASALQRKVWFNWGSSKVYPNLYVVLVGAPALGKGQAIKHAQSFLEETPKINLAPNKVTKEALVMELRQAKSDVLGDFIDAPDLETHNSLSLISGEFATFLGHKTVNTNMLTFLTDIFDCIPYKDVIKSDRSKNSDIRNTFLNILAASAEDPLAECIPAASVGGGFISRVLFIHATEKYKKISMPFFEEGHMKAIIADRLKHLSEVHGGFNFDESAQVAWDDWYYNEQDNVEERACQHQAFDYWYGRKNIFLLKLATIISAMEFKDLRETKNRIITGEHITKANLELKLIEGSMAQAFTSIGRNIYTKDLNVIEDAVNKYNGRITYSDLIKTIRFNVTDVTKVDLILASLYSSKILKRIHNLKEPTNPIIEKVKKN